MVKTINMVVFIIIIIIVVVVVVVIIYRSKLKSIVLNVGWKINILSKSFSPKKKICQENN